jgi:hypothetical protein
MAKSARPVVRPTVLAVLAGCTSPGFDKAGETQARQPVVLASANCSGDSRWTGSRVLAYIVHKAGGGLLNLRLGHFVLNAGSN